jgi:hypothetical protein
MMSDSGIQACPICGKQPDIGRCQPWPEDRGLGLAPWFVECASDQFAVNGDDEQEARDNWALRVSEFAGR